MRATRFYSLLTTLALGLGVGHNALAGTTVQTTLDVPAAVNGTISMEAHRAGPNIVIDGAMNLGSLDMVLLFRKHENKHDTLLTAEYGTNVTLLPVNGQIVVPRKRSKGGVGKNPHVWIQFMDDKGTALTEDMYLGKCSKGLNISANFLTKIAAALDLEGADCDQLAGKIIISGTLTFEGVNARFTLKNKFKGKRVLHQVMEMNLVAQNSVLEIPRQGLDGKLNGNPFISVQFEQNGQPVTEEVPLGKCNAL